MKLHNTESCPSENLYGENYDFDFTSENPILNIFNPVCGMTAAQYQLIDL